LNGIQKPRRMKLYDEYFKLDNAIKLDLPHITNHPNPMLKTVLEVPHQTRLPRSIQDAAVNVNEKFLDNWQSLIEEKMLPSWKKEFVTYENKHFSKHPLSTNAKEPMFHFMKLGETE
jgi:hypothetical protein